MEKNSTFEKRNKKPWKTQWIWSSGSGETDSASLRNHSEKQMSKKKGKWVVVPSGGGETAGILVFPCLLLDQTKHGNPKVWQYWRITWATDATKIIQQEHIQRVLKPFPSNIEPPKRCLTFKKKIAYSVFWLTAQKCSSDRKPSPHAQLEPNAQYSYPRNKSNQDRLALLFSWVWSQGACSRMQYQEGSNMLVQIPFDWLVYE